VSLYVSDGRNDCVQVIDPMNGTVKKIMGSSLVRPSGIAVAAPYLFVASRKQNMIAVFSYRWGRADVEDWWVGDQ